MLLSSFKTNGEIAANVWKLPGRIAFENYVTILWQDRFGTYIFNSVIILAASLLLILFISSLTAYGLARFEFKGNKLLYLYFLIGMMFPIQLGIVPLFRVVKDLNLTNTILGVVLINASVLSMPVFVLTGFIKTLPISLSEAAKIDGAGEFTIFFRIILPLMKTALGALTPLLSIGIWNDFFIPLVFLTKDAVKTIPIATMKYYIGEHLDYSKLSSLFTVLAVSIIPILAIYLFGSEKIVGELTKGSNK